MVPGDNRVVQMPKSFTAAALFNKVNRFFRPVQIERMFLKLLIFESIRFANGLGMEIESIETRVVGGSAVDLAPSWLGALLINHEGEQTEQLICGVILIAPDVAITAAHCIFGDNDDYRVAFGVTSRDEIALKSSVKIEKPQKIEIHEDYVSPAPGVLLNDIAVIIFEKKIVEYTPIRIVGI